ncbi:MAG: TRAP transporter small permease, partial [Desulfobacteraceae bacterium]|nr:TRAP transporter small permease [Desulfobacteraceae bacterium]
LAIGMGWVLVMMLLTTFDIAGRYFFSKPIPGTIELSEFMLAIFGIMGIAYTHQAGGNVRVTMLADALPSKWAAMTNTVANILSLVTVALLAWYGFVAGIEEFHVGTTTDSLGIPIYPLKFLLGIGAFLLCLEITVSLIESVREIFGIENSM